jgi:hypothetical protein
MRIKIENAECGFDGMSSLVTAICAAMATEGHFIERLDLKNANGERGAELTFVGDIKSARSDLERPSG